MKRVCVLLRPDLRRKWIGKKYVRWIVCAECRAKLKRV